MKQNEVGVSTGLAWTEAGGDVIFVEAMLMKGKGTLTMTGQLGDVMKGISPGRIELRQVKGKRTGYRC